ncbi:MAG: type II secretion system protein GspG [Armatimonadetes bacterium]|nr:type II secretion system protein GspG [Armatimonadota bacterium]
MKKALWAAAAAFVLLIAIVGIGAVRNALRDSAKLSAEMAAARPQPKLPRPNAFPDYVAAVNAIRDTSYNKYLSKVSPSTSKPRADLDRPATLAQKDALLKKNEAALRRLRQAFAHEYRAPPPAPSFDASFAHYKRFREMARLLAFESEVRAAHKDWDGAMSSAVDAIRLGEDVFRGSGLIGRLVGIAIQTVGRKGAWPAVRHLNADDAKAAARRMESLMARHVPLWVTMENEKEWTQAALREWYKDPDSLDLSDLEETEKGGPPARSSPLARLAMRRMIRTGYRNYTDYMEESIAKLKRPYPMQGPDPEVPQDVLTPILGPDPSAAAVRDTNNTAQNRLLTVALALQAYRAERGAYPRVLSALVPDYLKAVPADPFAKAGTLKYRRENGTYRLYSIGPDGKDDGGTPIDDPAEIARSEGNPRTRYSVRERSQGDIVAGVNP